MCLSGDRVEQAPWEAVSRQPSWLMFQNTQEMRLLAGRGLMEDEKEEMKPGWDTGGETYHSQFLKQGRTKIISLFSRIASEVT